MKNDEKPIIKSCTFKKKLQHYFLMRSDIFLLSLRGKPLFISPITILGSLSYRVK